ncbi:hypothetical protein [Streptomyces sp. NPDC050264]|uniref:hypothetical protein n=1 Tax=Streptomyces sp. NPDC050264 TaxID=3155038 RepID=UPI0034219973
MDTATLLGLGAAGGTVRGVVHAYDCMTEWLAGRRQHRLVPVSSADDRPTFGAFYDAPAEGVAAAVRCLLGAGVAMLLGTSGQVSGNFAVFASGASAPLVLVQLKNSRLGDVLLGGPSPPAPDGTAPPRLDAHDAVPEPELPPQRGGDTASVDGGSRQHGPPPRPATERIPDLSRRDRSTATDSPLDGAP